MRNTPQRTKSYAMLSLPGTKFLSGVPLLPNVASWLYLVATLPFTVLAPTNLLQTKQHAIRRSKLLKRRTLSYMMNMSMLIMILQAKVILSKTLVDFLLQIAGKSNFQHYLQKYVSSSHKRHEDLFSLLASQSTTLIKPSSLNLLMRIDLSHSIALKTKRRFSRSITVSNFAS